MTFSLAALVFWMLLAITVFAIISRLVRVPYPIVMLGGGALLALIPGLQPISLAPDIVFLVLLPLLLFGGAWTTDFRLFKRFLGPILWLALGLVVLTTEIVARAAHAWIGLPLASAFVLGAILSPSDAIATEAIASEVPFPEGSEAILSGESLVNDAAALVIYGFAVHAVTVGNFGHAPFALDFLYVAGAGIAIGIVIAWIVYAVARALQKSHLDDPLLAVLLSLVTPFLVYLPAQAAQASGVLAAVSGGVFLSSRSGRVFGAEQRVALAGVWPAITFALNGFAFILIGLQLRSVFAQLSAYTPWTLVAYALGIAALVVGVRLVTILVGGYARWYVRKGRGRDVPARPLWGDFFITGWSGMRGIVTLAGALAIPTVTASGAPFPGRAIILYLAFTTIVITLAGQGLTLPWIARRFGSRSDDRFVRELRLAQVRLAGAGRERLREYEGGFTSEAQWAVAARLIRALEERMGRADEDAGAPAAEKRQADVIEIDRTLRLAICDAERAALDAMRRNREIGDRAYRYTQYEIDLAESLLRMPQTPNF